LYEYAVFLKALIFVCSSLAEHSTCSSESI